MAQLRDAQPSNEAQGHVGQDAHDILPAHPAMPEIRPGQLAFRPAPTDETQKAVAPARRRRRRNWGETAFEFGWMALILACAAECVYRLLWAVQP